MKRKLLLFGLLFTCFCCHAQIGLNDSIAIINTTLRGTWVDSLSPYVIMSFKDSTLYLSGYDTTNNIVTSKFHYQIDTNCKGLHPNLKKSSIRYYIYARRLTNIDTIAKNESIEAPPHNEMYFSIECLNKHELYLYADYSEIELKLIKKK